jgi:hypothetical protein
MLPSNHCESALLKLQRIITLALRDEAPITSGEAYEQIIEELELAGFGSLEVDAMLAEAPQPQKAARRGH